LKEDRDSRMAVALKDAARGDSEAFADIVRQYQGMVFSIAWHFLHDRELAEDLGQDVFLELYQSIASVKSAAHLTYWLRRVTVNRCIDYGRRRKHRPEIALEDVPEPIARNSTGDPLVGQRLRALLAALPEKQRMIVILRYQEEMGPAEIAEVLEIPVNTVKSTLHRSLAELQSKLARRIREVRYALF